MNQHEPNQHDPNQHDPRPNHLTRLLSAVVVATLTSLLVPGQPPRRFTGSRGQATTEYALVLLAAALVAMLVVAWATAGGGAEKIARLFNRVVDSVIEKV